MAKKKTETMDEMEESQKESTASRLISVLTVIFIILIWLLVFAVCIKLDLGGFGSNVLTPLLKDVPVVNKILPDTGDETYSEAYSYNNLADANAKIKELKKQIDDLNSVNDSKDTVISDLESEIKRLETFEAQQKNFEKLKREFDEKVVFTDNAPDIAEYQKYYESIDPDNAADIYQQVVEQIQFNERVTEQANTYAKMDPAKAASVLEIMTSGDLDLVCQIISAMKPAASAEILANMDPATAAKITKRISMPD